MADAVIVVNYASSDLLTSCLSPLTQAGMLGVVVDNFSSVAEQERVHELAVENGWVALWQDNLGFGEGVNAGVEQAEQMGSTRFIILNPDAELSWESAQLLLEDTGNSTLVAPQIRRPDGSIWFNGAILDLRDGTTRSTSRSRADECSWLTGACLAFTSDTWKLVEGFAPGYFLYWEDVDLSYRLVQAGGHLKVKEVPHCIHAEGGTQTAGGLSQAGQPKSPTYYRYNITNRLVFCARNLDSAAWRRWLMSTPSVSWGILMEGGKRQLVRSPKPLWAAITGIWNGIRTGRRIRHQRSAPLPDCCATQTTSAS